MLTFPIAVSEEKSYIKRYIPLRKVNLKSCCQPSELEDALSFDCVNLRFYEAQVALLAISNDVFNKQVCSVKHKIILSSNMQLQ